MLVGRIQEERLLFEGSVLEDCSQEPAKSGGGHSAPDPDPQLLCSAARHTLPGAARSGTDGNPKESADSPSRQALRETRSSRSNEPRRGSPTQISRERSDFEECETNP